MSDIIDPTEIKNITSQTPITITFNDGSIITAYNFEFKNLTHYTTREEDDWYNVELDVVE